MRKLAIISGLLILHLSVMAAPYLGELSLFTTAAGAEADDIQVIARYLPAYETQGAYSETWDYDVEMRYQVQWNSSLDTDEISASSLVVEPYRLALNLQSTNTEHIIGLQKINFGPARILRSLMWFDSVNPMDPLELTPGVTGISTTHFYPSGRSSQAWLLTPGDPIGWEAFADQSGTFETGGRITLPNNHGQLGVTTHWRVADISSLYPDDPDLYEGRIGFDGFWDIGIGLWIESVYKSQRLSEDPFLEQLQTTLGADYTIWIGNGLLITTEHMMINMWNSPIVDDNDIILSTVMANYSPTMFDQLSLMFYLDWETETPLAYLSWGQTYDSFRFTLGAFYTDASTTQGSDESLNSNFSGKGIQLIVAYNH